MEAPAVVINFEELLKKYIQHVVEVEGIDFIDSCPTDEIYEPLGYTIFTPQEIDELKRLSQED